MQIGLIRRLILFLMIGAFLGAGFAQAAWQAPCVASVNISMTANPGAEPCHHDGMVPGCMTDLGCVLMVGVPTIAASIMITSVAWVRIDYQPVSRSDHGLTPEPLLTPPIFRG